MAYICSEGRGAAAEVDSYLMSNTRLPQAGGIKQRVSFRLPLRHLLPDVNHSQSFAHPPSKAPAAVAVQA